MPNAHPGAGLTDAVDFMLVLKCEYCRAMARNTHQAFRWLICFLRPGRTVAVVAVAGQTRRACHHEATAGLSLYSRKGKRQKNSTVVREGETGTEGHGKGVI